MPVNIRRAVRYGRLLTAEEHDKYAKKRSERTGPVEPKTQATAETLDRMVREGKIKAIELDDNVVYLSAEKYDEAQGPAN